MQTMRARRKAKELSPQQQPLVASWLAMLSHLQRMSSLPHPLLRTVQAQQP